MMGVPTKATVILDKYINDYNQEWQYFFDSSKFDKRFSFTSTAYEKRLQKFRNPETVNKQLFNFLISLFCCIQQQHRKQNQISKCSGEQCN
jgi:hypothetical protein